MTLASHLQYAEIPLRIGHGGLRHSARVRAHLQVFNISDLYIWSNLLPGGTFTQYRFMTRSSAPRTYTVNLAGSLLDDGVQVNPSITCIFV